MTGAQIRVRRRNNFNLVKEGAKLQSFDDFPMLRPEVDPQFHLSRNSVNQPFWLIGEKDMVLGQFSGSSRVEFASGPIRYFDLGLGDFVYVPAGAAHRISVREPGYMIRYKAREPGQEAVFWQCDMCGTELYRHKFDATAEPAQRGYQQGCEAFNGTDRTCGSCGCEHTSVDLSLFRWVQVADALLAQMEEDIGDAN